MPYRFQVPDQEYLDATLLLIAHGSTVNSDSATAAEQHAAALRARGLFAEVTVAFWKQAPFIADAAAKISSARVFVVPLFLSDGFFTQQIIPSELGFTRDRIQRFNDSTIEQPTVARRFSRGGSKWFYCPPFGTHPRMTDVVLSSAVEILGPNHVPFSQTALFLAAHGTGRNSDSRKAAEWQAARIQAQARFAEVKAVFMEEEPLIRDCTRLTSLKSIVVTPFFISDGFHAREDVPVLLGEDRSVVRQRLQAGQPTWINPTWREGKCIWYSRSIGTVPLVADLILERVSEAANDRAQAAVP